MGMLAANRLSRMGYGQLNNGAIVLIVGQQTGFLKGIVVSDTNGDPLPAFAGGLTDAELASELSTAKWYPLNGSPVMQLIANSITEITDMVFTFSPTSVADGLPNTVGVSEIIDVSSATTADQANYAAFRDLATFLIG